MAAASVKTLPMIVRQNSGRASSFALVVIIEVELMWRERTWRRGFRLRAEVERRLKLDRKGRMRDGAFPTTWAFRTFSQRPSDLRSL
ncbi:hypothetical protein [Mesorhizobium sp. WSM4312]|uniref:hypothetical protein n=1 Tax=Mesorhizobium sp. WSM4312 TaxID=2029411 RepID=UPI00117E10B3|nr:hypothetical protein [Mesorhizobium sp. WSM4312]